MKLAEVIKDLKRCAAQNEADARNGSDFLDVASCRGIAGEQRRMIRILSKVKMPGGGRKPVADRCPCGVMSAARATKRNHKCKEIANG